ncbi:hypothetical protein NMY22_g17736 [Coprinellus aureogranulatus]|nr:hypothetical protein NMY22_g17736 [Coprinellus aureogranulatus]
MPTLPLPVTTTSTVAWHPKVTVYRLLLTFTTIKLATLKAWYPPSLAVDWFAGTVLFLLCFFLSYLDGREDAGPSWLFQADLMRIVRLVIRTLFGFKIPHYNTAENRAERRLGSCKHPALTGYRLMVICATIYFGTSKTGFSFRSNETAAKMFEWVFAALVSIMLYWLGLYEYSTKPIRLFFEVNCAPFVALGTLILGGWALAWTLLFWFWNWYLAEFACIMRDLQELWAYDAYSGIVERIALTIFRLYLSLMIALGLPWVASRLGDALFPHYPRRICARMAPKVYPLSHHFNSRHNWLGHDQDLSPTLICDAADVQDIAKKPGAYKKFVASSRETLILVPPLLATMRWHPKITVYRMTLTTLLMKLATLKAWNAPSSLTVDWVAGMIVLLLVFFLSYCEGNENARPRWFFQADLMRTVRWLLRTLFAIKIPRYNTTEDRTGRHLASNPTLTGYRLLVTFAAVSFGTAKAYFALNGKETAAKTIEWVYAALVSIILYWLGLYEYSPERPMSRLFGVSYAPYVLWLIITLIGWLLMSGLFLWFTSMFDGLMYEFQAAWAFDPYFDLARLLYRMILAYYIPVIFIISSTFSNLDLVHRSGGLVIPTGGGRGILRAPVALSFQLGLDPPIHPFPLTHSGMYGFKLKETACRTRRLIRDAFPGDSSTSVQSFKLVCIYSYMLGCITNAPDTDARGSFTIDRPLNKPNGILNCADAEKLTFRSPRQSLNAVYQASEVDRSAHPLFNKSHHDAPLSSQTRALDVPPDPTKILKEELKPAFAYPFP